MPAHISQETFVRKSVHGSSRGLGVLATISLFAIVIAITVDVAWRTAFGGSVPGMVEFSEMLMVSLVFLGMAHTQARGGHVQVTLATSRLSPKIARFVRAGALVMMALIVCWMLVATAKRFYMSFLAGEHRFGLLEVPIWPARAVIPVGLALLLCETLLSAVDSVRGTVADADESVLVDG